MSGVSPSPVPGSTSGADADHQRSELRQRGDGDVPRSSGQRLSRPRHHLRQRRQLTDAAFNNANDGGTWTVTVVNPGGASSTAFTFTVVLGLADGERRVSQPGAGIDERRRR